MSPAPPWAGGDPQTFVDGCAYHWILQAGVIQCKQQEPGERITQVGKEGMMEKLVIYIEDRLRRKLVRLRVDEDRRIDTLLAWYVENFELPRRYSDLSDIEYELLRAAENRAISGPKTLREAGIGEGERLLLRSRKAVRGNERPGRRWTRTRRRLRLPEFRIRGSTIPLGLPKLRQAGRRGQPGVAGARADG